jgi:hypothetical protein
MMDEDKLLDKFTNSLTKAATQIAGAVVFAVFAAASMATQPFFRKNLGERYFTAFRVLISSLGWYALIVVSASYSQNRYGKVSVILVSLGIVILLAYLFLSYLNFRAIRRRKVTGEIWHSRSTGESLFGSENAKRDLLIEAVVFTLLLFVSVFHAGFFCLSRLMCYAAQAAAWAALYNRYLDIQDAKIESAFMETALREGFPPRLTGGVYRPLPGCFTGERRANVARIVAHGSFDANTADAAPGKPQTPQPAPAPSQTPKPPTTGQGREPEPIPSIPSPAANLKSAFQTAKDTAADTLASMLRSKRVIRMTIGVLVIVALVAVAIPVGRFIRAEWNRPAPVAASQSEPAQLPKAAPANDTPSISQVRKQSPALAAPAPEIKSAAEASNSAALAQAALELKRRQEQEKADAEAAAQKQAALELAKKQEAEKLAAAAVQQHQELEKPGAELAKLLRAGNATPVQTTKQQERDKVIEQIKSTLTNQTAQLSKFRTDMQTRLESTTNKIASTPSSVRKTLNKSNTDMRVQLIELIQNQEKFLNQFQETLPAMIANPRLDPPQINTRLTNSIAKIESERREFISILDSMDATISNSIPKKQTLDW